MEKNSEKVENIVDNSKVVKKVGRPKKSNQEYIIIEQKKTYTFRNLMPGVIFFTRENGTVEKFDGNSIRDDITEKERNALINNSIYKEGRLVEEIKESSEENIISKNSMSDFQISNLIDNHKNDQKFLEQWINGMDSVFAIDRFREALIKKNVSSSLVVLCEYKMKKIEEEEIAKSQAPVDKMHGEEE